MCGSWIRHYVLQTTISKSFFFFFFIAGYLAMTNLSTCLPVCLPISRSVYHISLSIFLLAIYLFLLNQKSKIINLNMLKAQFLNLHLFIKFSVSSLCFLKTNTIFALVFLLISIIQHILKLFHAAIFQIIPSMSTFLS